MPKIEPVYDTRDHDTGAYDGDEDDFEQEDEGSRLPLLIVIGLLVLAAFGGVVWLAYQHGVERGMRDAPRVAANQEAPATSPDYNKIYQKPAPSDEDTSNDDTAPPPPTPTFKPQAAPPSANTAATPSTTSAATPAPSTPPKSVRTAAAKPVAPPPVPASVQPQATKPPAKLVPDAQAASTTTAETKPVTPPPAAAVPAPSTPAATAPAASGDYVLQIGAYKSEDEASSSWKNYKTKHAIASGYPESIKQVDLGAKGTWYRLRIGGFATKDAATAFCAKLKANGGDCIAAKS
jgi:cell division septation protein DedD